MNREVRLKSHYESLSRAIGFTQLADAKAAPVVAVQIALAGTLAARSDRLASALVGTAWGAAEVVLAFGLVSYVSFLVASATWAASVYIPRTPRTGGSLIYFEDIGQMSLGAFKEESTTVGPETIESQLIEQVHTVSRIASTKMRRVRWAYYLSIPSVLLWIALLGWTSV